MKIAVVMMVVMMMAGSSFGRPQFETLETLEHQFFGNGHPSATAGGASTGTVQHGTAIGQGTGIAQVDQGGFGIGLGIGGAVETPLGEFTFGQGASSAVGK